MSRTIANWLQAPSILFLFLWMTIPLSMTLYFSFEKYNLFRGGFWGSACLDGPESPALWALILNTAVLLLLLSAFIGLLSFGLIALFSRGTRLYGSSRAYLGLSGAVFAGLTLAFFLWYPDYLAGDFWFTACFRNYRNFIGPMNFAAAFADYPAMLRWDQAAAPWFFIKLPLLALMAYIIAYRAKNDMPVLHPYNGFITASVGLLTAYLGISVLMGLVRQPFVQGIIDSLYRIPFLEVVLNTLFIVFGILSLTLIFGLLIAMLINRAFPGRGIARVLIISPFFIMPAVNALMWSNLLVHPTNGLLASILTGLGIEPINLFGPIYGAYGIILILAWQWTPFAVLIFMTSLQSEDQEQKEAAILDGASAWSQFWNLTLPHLGRPIAIVMMIQLIFHLSLYAEIDFTGAAAGAETLAFAIDAAGISGGSDFGRAAAGGVFAIILANIAALILIRIVGRNLTD